ncbi:hypothetical protein GWI33_015784, partial [Rhynchophorus ferrugineus]
MSNFRVKLHEIYQLGSLLSRHLHKAPAVWAASFCGDPSTSPHPPSSRPVICWSMAVSGDKKMDFLSSLFAINQRMVFFSRGFADTSQKISDMF